MVRPLLHFFLIGGLLFGVRIAIWGPEEPPPEVTVGVPVNATREQVESRIREAILLAEARRNGWDLRDPIVFRHLVRNMRFIEPDTEDDDLALFGRAIEMKMHERDPIVRARLLQRAEAAMTSVPEEHLPSKEALEVHRAAHLDRFEREGKVRFEHVFLSRSKRGGRLQTDAATVFDKIRGLDDPQAAHRFGDPLPGVRAVQTSSLSRISRDYGKSLAEAADRARIGVWEGPIETVYGLHFLRVLARMPAFVPPLSEIETEVRADLISDVARGLASKRYDALRNAYVIHVERVQ